MGRAEMRKGGSRDTKKDEEEDGRQSIGGERDGETVNPRASLLLLFLFSFE